MIIKCDEYKIGYLVNIIIKPFDFPYYEDYAGIRKSILDGREGVILLTLVELKLIYKHYVKAKNNGKDSSHFLGCGEYLANLLNEYDMGEIMSEPQRKPFDTELEHLINKHGIDNDCGVPDYVLAAFMVQSLEPLKSLVKGCNKYSGKISDYTFLNDESVLRKAVMPPPVNIDEL